MCPSLNDFTIIAKSTLNSLFWAQPPPVFAGKLWAESQSIQSAARMVLGAASLVMTYGDSFLHVQGQPRPGQAQNNIRMHTYRSSSEQHTYRYSWSDISDEFFL